MSILFLVIFSVLLVANIVIWHAVGYQKGANATRKIALEDLKASKEIIDRLLNDLKAVEKKVEPN